MNFQRSKIAARWDEIQDKMILEGIRKFGFNWNQIMKFMKKTRSVNSILRRWHSKLKNDHLEIVKSVSQSKSKEVNQKLVVNNPSNQKNSNRTKKQQIKKKIEIKQQESEEYEQEQEEQIVEQKVEEKQVLQKKYAWSRQWKEEDDNKLKKLVFVQQILDLNQLAKNFNVSKEELKHRWKTQIFPKIRIPVKAKLYKWCDLQDKILRIGSKKQVDWHSQVTFLLPGRTIASIQSRWRRMVISKKTQDVVASQEQIPQFINKHEKRRLFLLKLGKRMAKQQQQQKEMINEGEEQKRQQMVLQ